MAGSLQLYTGQISGCEAAVHSVREDFQEESAEAALLVDASNAFNSLDRVSALHNIRTLRPSIAYMLINCYRAPTDLFIDGDVILSQYYTQGDDPLAMPMYALATLPLIKRLPSTVKQTWYADDAAATGKIASLRTWWDEISRLGPSYGYYANGSKTWLVIRQRKFLLTQVCKSLWKEDLIWVPPLSCSAYVNKFVSQKVQQWSTELTVLSEIASIHPHAAFAALTHALSSKWSYVIRTTPSIGHLLQPLDAILRSTLIPNLTGRPPPNEIDLRLFALPARLGGLGITYPSAYADRDFEASA